MMTSKPNKYGIEYLRSDGFWIIFKEYPKQKDAIQAFSQIRANMKEGLYSPEYKAFRLYQRTQMGFISRNEIKEK